MQNDVTIIFVSFFSEKILLEYIKKLAKFRIIVIENSKNYSLVTKLKKYKNIKVIVNKKNLGFGTSVNIAIKNISTKYALHLDLDTKIDVASIKKLIKFSKKHNDFGVLTGKIKDFKYNKDQYLKKNILKNCDQMINVDGCLMLFNLKFFKNKIFDENIFLYFEETDLFRRCMIKNLKILKLNTVIFSHKGRSSTENKYNTKIEINRNWHYMWSKFYYNKKHYGYFYALRKSFKNLFSSFLKGYCFPVLYLNKSKVYKARFNGCLSSILLKKSSYRPDIYY
mgnify:CR=1 FL=1